MLERRKSCGVGWAWVRLRILENIHVVFAGRELATTQSFVWSHWSVIGGFTRDVVAFQKSRKVMLISIVGGAWRVRMASISQFCWKRFWLSPMWSWNVFQSSAIWATHLGQEEAARARVRCAWAKFKELSPDLTARGASYRIKGRIYRACVQSALTYGTETCAMKKANLQSLERTERMMVRWMRWRIGNTAWICTVFWVYRASMRWWGRVDWGELGMWKVRVGMIGVSA